jgi:hypothetical protein
MGFEVRDAADDEELPNNPWKPALLSFRNSKLLSTIVGGLTSSAHMWPGPANVLEQEYNGNVYDSSGEGDFESDYGRRNHANRKSEL